MPRILVAGFCAFPGPDRAGVQLRHVVRALQPDAQVDVLSVRRGDQAYVERWQGARLLRVPVSDGPLRVRLDAFRRALRRQLEGADYHAIHVRDGVAGQVALELAARLKLAVVYDAARAPLSNPGALDPEAAAASEAVEVELLERADLVLVGTEVARRYLAEAGGGERIHRVPPGVDVDAFDWDQPRPGRPRILYAGPLAPGRGVRVLVRAMLDLPVELDAELVLAGPAAPGFVEGLRIAIHELGLVGRVTLAAETPYEQLPALIATAQVCVAPSAADLGALPTALYPTKLLEYMACQRAVLAPRRTTVAQLIRDDDSGVLFEPSQPADLAAKLARLLGDRELCGRLARTGYELVRRAHTASETRRELRRAYAWLAGQPAVAARFTELLEDGPTGDVVAPGATGDVSDAGGLVDRRAASGRGRAISAFDDGIALDDDDAPVDTGVHEGFGEVTKVEGPLAGGYSLGGDDAVALATAEHGGLGDDWVVEDSRIRDAALGERTSSHPRLGGPADSRFVSGELEVPSAPRPAAVEFDPPFVAMAPPLGFARPARAPAAADPIEPPAVPAPSAPAPLTRPDRRDS